MGYEVKLVLTEAYTVYSTGDAPHGVIATVDLSKPGEAVNKVCVDGQTNPAWYYYADDGNTQVFKDKYDDPIREVDVNRLIKVMEREKSYRRFQMAIPLLKAAQATFPNLRVFAYGH
jgi:hypothetical protein